MMKIAVKCSKLSIKKNVIEEIAKACIDTYIHKHKDFKAIKVNNQWNLLNENNDTVIENIFSDVFDFREGLAKWKMGTGR